MCRALELHAPAQNVHEHHPVTKERINRMLERSRPIVLEEKMPNPRKPIPAAQRRKQPPGIAAPDRHADQRQHPAAPDKMQPPANHIRMLPEIERIKLPETRELHFDSDRFARTQSASCASRSNDDRCTPSAAAITSIIRNRRSNFRFARRNADPTSTF